MALKAQIKPTMLPTLGRPALWAQEGIQASYLLSFLSTSLVALASNSLEQKAMLVPMSTTTTRREATTQPAGRRAAPAPHRSAPHGGRQSGGRTERRAVSRGQRGTAGRERSPRSLPSRTSRTELLPTLQRTQFCCITETWEPASNPAARIPSSSPLIPPHLLGPRTGWECGAGSGANGSEPGGQSSAAERSAAAPPAPEAAPARRVGRPRPRAPQSGGAAPAAPSPPSPAAASRPLPRPPPRTPLAPQPGGARPSRRPAPPATSCM